MAQVIMDHGVVGCFGTRLAPNAGWRDLKTLQLPRP